MSGTSVWPFGNGTFWQRVGTAFSMANEGRGGGATTVSHPIPSGAHQLGYLAAVKHPDLSAARGVAHAQVGSLAAGARVRLTRAPRLPVTDPQGQGFIGRRDVGI